MRPFCLSCLCAAVLFASTRASAEVSISYTSTPTPGLDGFATLTFLATSSDAPISSFNFLQGFNSEPYGFSGTFNQVNPFGIVTVWNDLPPPIYTVFGSDVAADTHFLANSNFGGSESSSSLQGWWLLSGGNPATSIEFAQIVTPYGATVSYEGEVWVGNVVNEVPFHVQGSVTLVPEPSPLLLASFAAAFRLRRRSNPTASNPETIR
jgi:hypothetical protein